MLLKKYSKMLIVSVVLVTFCLAVMGAALITKREHQDSMKKEIMDYFSKSYGKSPTNYIVTPDMHVKTEIFDVRPQNKKHFVKTFFKYFDVKQPIDYAMITRLFVVKKGMIACNTPQGVFNAEKVLATSGGVYHTTYSSKYNYISPITEAPGCVTNFMPNLVFIRNMKKVGNRLMAQVNFVALEVGFYWHKNTGWISMRSIEKKQMTVYDYVKPADFGLINPYAEQMKKLKKRRKKIITD